jgi:hypothetical protein
MIKVLIDADNQSYALAPFLLHFLQSSHQLMRSDIHCYIAGNSDGKRLQSWLDALKQLTIPDEQIMFKKVPSIEDAADIQLIFWMQSIIDSNKKRSAISRDKVVIVSRDGLLIRAGQMLNEMYKIDVSIIASDHSMIELPKENHCLPIIILPVRDNKEYGDRRASSVIGRFDSMEHNINNSQDESPDSIVDQSA